MSKILWVFNISFTFVYFQNSSEGSLTQHLKLKHPDYFAKIGLSQISALKEFEEFKSIISEDKNESCDIDGKTTENKSIREDQENNQIHVKNEKSQSNDDLEISKNSQQDQKDVDNSAS